jgi:hypothetical protein
MSKSFCPRLAQYSCGGANLWASGHQPSRTEHGREEKWQSQRESQAKKADEVARRSTPFRGEGIHREPKCCYVVTRPSEVARACGTPHSLIITWPDVSERTLRANRCAHESR